jgi:hypothetical protein
MKNQKITYEFKNSGFRKFVLHLLRFYMGLIVDLELENADRIEEKGAVMFAANHVSNYDGILMQLAIERPLCFMSKAELFRNPVFAWVLNRIGSFPVRRGEFDRQRKGHPGFRFGIDDVPGRNAYVWEGDGGSPFGNRPSGHAGQVSDSTGSPDRCGEYP